MIKVTRSQTMETFWRDNEAWDMVRHKEHTVKIFGITVYRNISDHNLTPKEFKENKTIGFTNGK